MIGDFGGSNLRDVAVYGVTAGEVLGIGFLRVAVPLAGEYTTSADILECPADAADAGEEIDESEIGLAFNRRIQRQQALQTEDVVPGNRLPDLPAANGTRIDTEVTGDSGLFMVLERFREVSHGQIVIGAGMQDSGHENTPSLGFNADITPVCNPDQR